MGRVSSLILWMLIMVAGLFAGWAAKDREWWPWAFAWGLFGLAFAIAYGINLAGVMGS